MRRIISCQFNIYNDPLAYVGLVMSGKSEEYLKAVTR